MSDDQKLIAVGTYVYGALALSGLFILGLTVQDHYAAAAAITSAGLSYSAQVAAFHDSVYVNIGFSIASLLVGVYGLIAALV